MAANPPSGEGGNGAPVRSSRDRLPDIGPRLIRLVRDFGHDRISAIMFSPDNDMTMTQRLRRLGEEMNAFEAAAYCSTDFSAASLLRAAENFNFDEDDDDEDNEQDEDEDAETGKLLGDETKPGVVKRPEPPVEGEIECKKPRIAQGSGCQGEEPEAGETKNSSRV